MADWQLPRTFESPQGTIRWDSFGDGPPIVLLHGAPGSSFIWRNVVDHLSPRHRVLVFDWPGFGRSARFAGQNITWDEQPRRLPELFAHWGITAPTVVAFDFSAIVALRAHFFAGLDVGAFIFADAAAIPPMVTGFSSMARENIAVMRQLPTHIAEGMIATHLSGTTYRPMSQDVFDRYMAPWRGDEGVAAYWRTVAILDQDLAAPLRSRMGQLTMPTRLLWGEQDTWIPPEKGHELAAALPNTELRFIPDAGHFSPEDNPSGFAEEILNFERDLNRAAP